MVSNFDLIETKSTKYYFRKLTKSKDDLIKDDSIFHESYIVKIYLKE